MLTEWQYSQSTGHLLRRGSIVATGYSGHGTAINDHECEAIPDAGPIPVGLYKLGAVRDSSRTGPLSIELEPVGHNACGRTALEIHGDNAKQDRSASHGCVIMPRWIRVILANECRAETVLLEVIV